MIFNQAADLLLLNQFSHLNNDFCIRITEFLWNVFCIVNKISMELTSKSLYNELKVLML